MASLAGKHALVTGGGTGVGARIALALAEAGAAVTVCGRRNAPLEETASRHPAIGHVCGDVTDTRSVAAMFDEAARSRGAVGIVVANAGAAASKPFLKMDASDLDAMLSVNLGGVFSVWQAGLPSMLEARWGRLIAIASTAGLKGYPYVSAYCAAKHGVIGLTRALATELAGSGVTANAICPGFTETPMLQSSIETIMRKTGRSRAEAEAILKQHNPQGRFIQPEEIAESVLWLCDDASRSVTGQAISISGGEI
jgi:NAD(P)-dependent dehydrogenase (short-subunit alcohol dehydrogenase family)